MNKSIGDVCIFLGFLISTAMVCSTGFPPGHVRLWLFLVSAASYLSGAWWSHQADFFRERAAARVARRDLENQLRRLEELSRIMGTQFGNVRKLIENDEPTDALAYIDGIVERITPPH